MILLRLFFEFMRAGLFAVGGGLATIPFLYDISDRTGWFSHVDLANMIAVSESTPGPIGVNTATYAGYLTAGIPGAAVATLGLIFPSVVVILVVARLLDRYRSSKAVDSVFYGLRPASTALIAAAGFGVMKLSLLALDRFAQSGNWLDLVRWSSVVLAVALFFAIRKWDKLHPVVFIALSAVAGILLRLN